MADVNSAVSLGINSPDPNQGLNTLSRIMSLGQQGLSIRGEQSRNVTLASQATEAQQNAKEKMAGAQLLSDPVGNGLVDETGAPTPGAQAKILAAMPTTGSQHVEGLLNGARAKVQFNSAVNDLRTSERAELADAAGGVAARAQSPDEITDTLDNIVESKKGTPEYGNYQTIAGTMKQAINHLATKTAGNNPTEAGKEPWRLGALNMASSILPAASTVGPGGLATPQATTVQTTGGTQGAVAAPALQGGGLRTAGPVVAAPPTVAPGPGGQLLRVAPGAASATPIETPAPAAAIPHPRTAQDDAPPPNAPRAAQEAYTTAVTNANAHVDSVRTADETYGNNKAIANAVRTLSSGAKTGPGTETWNHVMGVLGTKGANNYQELGAFLDRQAATVRGQMGLPGTNAGQEDAKMIAGNTSYNAKVIQDKNNYTEALTDGLHMYRNGLDRVAGFSGQASPAQVSKFKSAWTNVFDPNVLIGENAYRRSKADGDAFVSSLDPKEAASLRAKRQAMLDLSSGKLPQ